MSRKQATTENVPTWILMRRARQRAYYHKNKDKCRGQMLKYRYGLSGADYSRLLLAQGGRCFICEKPASENIRRGHTTRLLPDHNHKTGEIRSLLCHRCNIVLGMIEMEPEIAEKMLLYLKNENYKALNIG